MESLLKDAPNKGHIFNLCMWLLWQILWSLQIMTIQFSSEREQPLYNSKITPKLAGPKVCIIKRFYCIYADGTEPEPIILA